MSTSMGNRAKGSPQVDADEIIKSARRRSRAANSRRRGLIGESSTATDGQLALETIVDPIEVEPEIRPDSEVDVEPQPTPEPRVRRSPKKATPPAPVATARAPFVLTVLGLIAAGIVGLLVLNTAINSNAFMLQDLRENQTKLDASEQELTDEMAELKSPGNLAAAADRLGLVEATDVTYLRLPDGKELKMPKPGDN